MNDAIPQEIQAVSKLADLRARVLRGEQISPQDYAEVIRSIRTARKVEGARPSKKGNSKAPPNVDSDKLLNDFVV